MTSIRRTALTPTMPQIILLKKDELASLDEDSADDPAILHHTLSKLPTFIETPDSPPSPPMPTTPTTEAPDEDLMSSSASTATLSTLTNSTASLSSLDLSLDLSLEAMDDSLFTDPDVYSPGLYSSPPRAPAQRHSEPFPPSSPAAPPPSSIGDLITRALELYTLYPLIGDVGGEKGEHIAADEVMGPKSCVFTWPLSVEDRLSDEGADEIARKGVDIVLPVPVVGASKEEEEEVIAEKVEERRRKLMAMKGRRRKVEVGVGAVLAVVGVAGVLLAVYGAEWRTLGKEASGGRWGFGSVWR